MKNVLLKVTLQWVIHKVNFYLFGWSSQANIHIYMCVCIYIYICCLKLGFAVIFILLASKTFDLLVNDCNSGVLLINKLYFLKE